MLNDSSRQTHTHETVCLSAELRRLGDQRGSVTPRLGDASIHVNDACNLLRTNQAAVAFYSDERVINNSVSEFGRAAA